MLSRWIARKYNFVEPEEAILKREREREQSQSRKSKLQAQSPQQIIATSSTSSTSSSPSPTHPTSSNLNKPIVKMLHRIDDDCDIMNIEESLIHDIGTNLLCGLNKRRKLKMLKELQAELEEQEVQKKSAELLTSLSKRVPGGAGFEGDTSVPIVPPLSPGIAESHPSSIYPCSSADIPFTYQEDDMRYPFKRYQVMEEENSDVSDSTASVTKSVENEYHEFQASTSKK